MRQIKTITLAIAAVAISAALLLSAPSNDGSVSLPFGADTAYAAPSVPSFAYEFTGNTDVDTATERILSTAADQVTAAARFADCYSITVCADPDNTDEVYVGTASTNVHLQGVPLSPLASTGETCVTFNGFRNAGKGAKKLDGRKLYAAGVASNNKVYMWCEL